MKHRPDRVFSAPTLSKALRLLLGLVSCLLAGPANAQNLPVNHWLAADAQSFAAALDRNRPAPIAESVRVEILKSLPKEGLVRLTSKDLAKLSMVIDVLRAHHRDTIYEVRVFVEPQIFVGLYARFVLLISEAALRMLTPDELQSFAAHEIGHDFVWERFNAAKAEHDEGKLRDLEQYCDAIAIITLRGIGADPNHLLLGIAKATAFNRLHFGRARNESSYFDAQSRIANDQLLIRWSRELSPQTMARFAVSAP